VSVALVVSAVTAWRHSLWREPRERVRVSRDPRESSSHRSFIPLGAPVCSREITRFITLRALISESLRKLFCGQMAAARHLCSDEGGLLEISQEQVRIGQDRVAQIGPCQVRPDEGGPGKIGFCQIGSRQVSHAQIGPGELGCMQISLCQVAMGEIPVTQVGPTESGCSPVGKGRWAWSAVAHRDWQVFHTTQEGHFVFDAPERHDLLILAGECLSALDLAVPGFLEVLELSAHAALSFTSATLLFPFPVRLLVPETAEPLLQGALGETQDDHRDEQDRLEEEESPNEHDVDHGFALLLSLFCRWTNA
jgi:hypothetical protein